MGDAKAGVRAYMKIMIKNAAIALLLLTSAASAQSGLILPPSPAEQNAQTQAQLKYQQLQTQLNNLQTQQAVQETQLRQQQLFNSQATMFNQLAVPPPPRP